MALSEASLMTDLKWDVEAMFRRDGGGVGIWDKRRDASKKGVPDTLIIWRGFTSFLEGKYVRDGERALARILDSPLQLATMAKAGLASGGRAFYAVWVQEGPERRAEIWVPFLSGSGAPSARRAQVRRDVAAFSTGIFLERLEAQHSAGWRP